MLNKILIMSDSHERIDISEILENEAFDLAIHAGDSQLPADDKVMQSFNFKVRGNCDWDRKYDSIIFDTINNLGNISVTHGHLLHTDVKLGLDAVEDMMIEENLNLIIYGHNHIVNVDYRPNYDCLILNPGSAGISKSQYPETYMILEYTQDQYIVNVKDAHTMQVIAIKNITRNING